MNITFLGTGTSQGLGGSMHIFSKEHRFYGGHGIVGGQIPLGAGIAFGDKYHGSDAVTLCCFGDGAARQGSLHETFNLAMLWKLPVIFICENNGYAEATATDWHLNTKELSDITKAYNMKSYQGDGNNVFEVYEITKNAILESKKNEIPIFLEFKNYRFSGQYEGDTQLYQPKEEVENAKKNDPIKIAKENASKYELDVMEIEKIQNEALAEVNNAFAYADTQPWPKPEDALEEVYVNYPSEYK